MSKIDRRVGAFRLPATGRRPDRAAQWNLNDLGILVSFVKGIRVG